MESKIFGVLDKDNCLIDICRTEKGVKRYATLNGYDKVGYRVGYNAFILAQKINNKWENYKEPNNNTFERELLNEQEQCEQNLYCPKHENY